MGWGGGRLGCGCGTLLLLPPALLLGLVLGGCPPPSAQDATLASQGCSGAPVRQCEHVTQTEVTEYWERVISLETR